MMPAAKLGPRFWTTSVTSAIFLALMLLTVVLPDWIEVVFRADPDGGSGAVEWAVVVLFGCVGIANGLVARIQWRRAAQATM